MSVFRSGEQHLSKTTHLQATRYLSCCTIMIFTVKTRINSLFSIINLCQWIPASGNSFSCLLWFVCKILTRWSHKSEDEAKNNKSWQNMKLHKTNNSFFFKFGNWWMTKWVPHLEKAGMRCCSYVLLKSAEPVYSSNHSHPPASVYEQCLKSVSDPFMSDLQLVLHCTLSTLTSHSSNVRGLYMKRLLSGDNYRITTLHFPGVESRGPPGSL